MAQQNRTGDEQCLRTKIGPGERQPVVFILHYIKLARILPQIISQGAWIFRRALDATHLFRPNNASPPSQAAQSRRDLDIDF